MQFWDSSAVLPLVMRQPPFSDWCRRVFHPRVPRATAFLTRVECRSAIERSARGRVLDPAARRRAFRKIDTLLTAFDVVAFSPDVEAHALALLRHHALRSLDALQLGCAQSLVTRGDPMPDLVCCDRRLAEAAGREGFSLVIDL